MTNPRMKRLASQSTYKRLPKGPHGGIQLLLIQNVEHVGKQGEVVEVKPGYAKNYLLPQGLAALATERNVKEIEHQKKIIAARNAKLLKDAQTIGEKISGVTVKISRQTGEGGKLFGSISTRDIEEGLSAQGVTVDRKKIVIADPIKSTGEYTVDVKLGLGVVGKVKVIVSEAAKS